MGGTELIYNLFAECQIGDWHEGLCVSSPEQVWPVRPIPVSSHQILLGLRETSYHPARLLEEVTDNIYFLSWVSVFKLLQQLWSSKAC